MTTYTGGQGGFDTSRLANSLLSQENLLVHKNKLSIDINAPKLHTLGQKLGHKGSIHNEICRKTYLLHILGAMLNWEFLPVKGKRPIDLNGYYLNDWTKKKFSIKECLSASGATGIGVKTGLNLLCLDFDGESAFDIASEADIDWQVNE